MMAWRVWNSTIKLTGFMHEFSQTPCVFLEGSHMPYVTALFIMALAVIAGVAVVVDKREHHIARGSCQHTEGNRYVIDRNNIGHCVRTLAVY
jgi:hypothetical protein